MGAEIMYRFELHEHLLPNASIERRYKGDEFKGYRITANDGFVFKETETYYNEETKEEEVTVSYSTVIYTPKNYDFKSFKYEIVPCEDAEEENYTESE